MIPSRGAKLYVLPPIDEYTHILLQVRATTWCAILFTDIDMHMRFSSVDAHELIKTIDRLGDGMQQAWRDHDHKTYWSARHERATLVQLQIAIDQLLVREMAHSILSNSNVSDHAVDSAHAMGIL